MLAYVEEILLQTSVACAMATTRLAQDVWTHQLVTMILMHYSPMLLMASRECWLLSSGLRQQV